MRLKSLTLKGFKSFPDRTRLDFGPGVSVIVGPNGSGKSNVTDAVLWAMGEQSPLAVRGQSMQDVIFGGGRGVQARSAAEVEIVLDNSDGRVDLPLTEISIVRRLDRTGEGGYRLNGARCRLTDVIEVLSDTGLGKETHSVISQGRVESIVTSKPRDRRLLIEEAAGLGKHRKRRRRAQLKLERTQENLDRALDVEHEARSRLRPLKRQAESAELHERLELQLYEARWTLAREAVRASAVDLRQAETSVADARARRASTEAELQAIVERRSLAETALAERTERHDALSRRAYEIRSARERIQLRGEQAEASLLTVRERAARIESELASLGEAGSDRQTRADGQAGVEGQEGVEGRTDDSGSGAEDQAQSQDAAETRVQALEAELVELDRASEQELEREIEGLQEELEGLADRVAELEEAAGQVRERRAEADISIDAARAELRQTEAKAQAARREAASVGAELAAVNQFLSSHARFAAAGAGGARALSEALTVADGYELALAAALGGRLDAALVRDLGAADELLDRAGPDGASALLAGDAASEAGPAVIESSHGAAATGDANGEPATENSDPHALAADEGAAAQPDRGAGGAGPAPGAIRLIDLVSGSAGALELAGRFLADAWVVERLADVRPGFGGIAATRNGRVLFGAFGEVRQAHAGGAERVLARRNERERLIASSEAAAQAEQEAGLAVQSALDRVRAAEEAGVAADQQLREGERGLAEARESERQAGWLIEQRRSAPDQGPLAVRRAQLLGELAAERRQAERLAAERAQREQRIAYLKARKATDAALASQAPRLAAVLSAVGEVADSLLAELAAELSRDRAAGEEVASELRACAHEEAAVQSRLRAIGEQVTAAEVSAQRSRDQAAEARQELRSIAERLQRPVPGQSGEADAAPEVGGEDVEATARVAAGEAGPAPEAAAEGAAAEEEVGGEDGEAMAPLAADEEEALRARVERLERRREQLGPVNPLAKEEYAEALDHVQELETRRSDLETALRELKNVIRDTDRQIAKTFEETFEAAAKNFEELAGDVFPGGTGRLRLVRDEQAQRGVLGGQSVDGGTGGETGEVEGEAAEAAADAEAEREQEARQDGLEDDALGVEIEITPAGKATKRLSLLSGGEKSMTALAFLFAVFLAKPCPFYILDEVEAALDDLNLDRFLALLRRYSDRAQFIVITHQKRTMEAADWLFGVSMAGNGVSKVLSRRLPPEALDGGAEVGEAAPDGDGDDARGTEDGETDAPVVGVADAPVAGVA
ncbi:MAG TPA: AAA family ATPase [Solirubrobacteraceae bacterium]|nr:AAA family ATPase [Solirubrobacteraceae bacterium]